MLDSPGIEYPESGDSIYGFKWGQVVVERMASFMPRVGSPCSRKMLRVRTDSTAVEIYVSPGGRSIRVFKDGKELK